MEVGKSLRGGFFGAAVNACRNFWFICILLGDPSDTKAVVPREPVFVDQQEEF